MTTTPVTPDRRFPIPGWLILLISIVALALVTAALTATLLSRASGASWFPMMGAAAYQPSGAQPGNPGFIAGTPAHPRIVHVWAGPGYAFSPSTIRVARGETVTFVVTAMGPLVHQFMVGPADAVAGDVSGTPEVDDIRMMQSASVAFTFDGSGPYAFACHAPGHYEAGMRGTIEVVD